MVASTHNLDDLEVSHVASASQEHQNQHHSQKIQEATDKNQHNYLFDKLNQSAQDKRSRLSNVINNLHKKVPPEITKSDCQTIIKKSKTNSIDYNLDKYVMTVLSGVIEVEEKNSNKKELETDTVSQDSLAKSTEIIVTKNLKDLNSSAIAVPFREEDVLQVAEVHFEPCEAHENKVDAAFPIISKEVNKDNNMIADYEKKNENKGSKQIKIIKMSDSNTTACFEKNVSDCHSRIWNQDEEETDENLGSLGAIILDRLNDRHQNQTFDDEINEEDINSELRILCQELLNDLLNDIIKNIEISDQKIIQNDSESHFNNSTQSFHCSLPLDKIALVLPTCKISNSSTAQFCNISVNTIPLTPSKVMSSRHIMNKSLLKNCIKVNSTTVKHLCLYCDRKFLSISLRQRHIERVHQMNRSRRSERNSRKLSQQSCQFCVNKYTENLEGLFQHMVGNHSDKYYGCLQCSTRYLTRDALTSHIHEIHSHVTVQMEKLKEPIPTSIKDIRVLTEAVLSTKVESHTITKQSITFDQSTSINSSILDNSFYSTVSCNIRENLLHHIDGKIQLDSCSVPSISSPVYNSAVFTDSNIKNLQYQLPIDISLTAIAPIYNKKYPMAPENYQNSSENAGKPTKTCTRTRRRRISFEKYNFPRKYDVKEQWSCSIKDLSKFDISTQLSLHKKQRIIKDCTTLSRLESMTSFSDKNQKTKDENIVLSNVNIDKIFNRVQSDELVISDNYGESDKDSDEHKNIFPSFEETLKEEPTVFSSEFESFMMLKKWKEKSNDKKNLTIVYAELTGEWSRPRVYICGACAERYVTLKELEEHKSSVHPNVWCMHFEFSGDQRELYKHLMFLPRQSNSTTINMKTRQQTICNVTPEKICTKCAKSCTSFAELHRHMLECGGDQAWLLGLFGNGKKKCKWRPFGSRSRRRRQRGMKRNIQNSQTCRNVPKEKQPCSGPRVRPSDRESIQKMLANLPAKRTTRKVLQENAILSQGRLRNVKTKTVAVDNTASRIVRNKAVLRNKLLKNAKSFQRKKNLRKKKQLENESQINEKEFNKALRNSHLISKKKIPVVSMISDIQNSQQQLKRRSKPRYSTSTNQMSSEIIFKSYDSTRKKTISKILETEPNITIKPKKNKCIEDKQLDSLFKTKTQLRTNDGKFTPVIKKNLPEFDNKSNNITRKFGMDSLRFLTRSKLRAAAKMAWQEHTKISHRMTRLRSFDPDKAVMTESNSISFSKDGLIEFTKLKVSRTGSKNSISSQRSFNGIETHSEKILDNVTNNKSEGTAIIVPRGKKSKKNILIFPKSDINVNESESVDKHQQLETINERKTRSKKTLYLNVGTEAKIEHKMRPLPTYKNCIKKINTDLSKKNQKNQLSSPFTLIVKKNKGNCGLATRSNSRIKKKTKEKNEYSIKVKRNSSSKERNEKSISKYLQKELMHKKLTVKVEKSLDYEVKLDISSPLKKEKQKFSVLRKSPRNKETDVKEIVDKTEIQAIKKVEEALSLKLDKLNDKNNTVITLIEKKIAQDYIEKDLCNTTEEKSNFIKRRGRTKRIIQHKEKINPQETSLHNQENMYKFEQMKRSNEAENSISASSKINAGNKLSSTSTSIKINSNLQNLTLEHLQQESSNSNMDSGKENSSETIVSVSKLKVARPKKLRGLRRDNKAVNNKRSINNVIGILTDGVNVPIDAQDTTIVLTVQTSINTDNNNSENTNDLTVENNSFDSDESNSRSTDIFNLDNNTDIINLNKVENLNDEKIQNLNKNFNFEDLKNREKIIEPILSKKQSDNKILESNLTSIEQPENDIILDLSRRKPKGKGSFLEKIVSKIAKQKDVSLDSENSCYLNSNYILLKNENNLDRDKKMKTYDFKKINEMQKIESENIINKKSNADNEIKIVNMFNNSENNVILHEKSENYALLQKKNSSDCIKTNEEYRKCAKIEIDINNLLDCRVKIKDEILNSAVIQVNSNKIFDTKDRIFGSDKLLPFSGKISKTEMKQILNSKKRLIESNLSKQNKKKIIDNIDLDKEKNKEEIILADIKKLIERPKSNEVIFIDQNPVKPGKRKKKDDDTEFNNINTNINIPSTLLEYKKDEETTTKTKCRGNKKKNKNYIDNVIGENIIKKTKDTKNYFFNLEKQDKKSVNLKVINYNDEIIEEKSAIILGSTTEILDENETLKYEEINTKSNENKTLLVEFIKENFSKLNKNININNESVQNSELEDYSNIDEKQKKLSKNNTKIVQSSKSLEKISVSCNNSLKNLESTKIIKPIKKHTIKKKSKIINKHKINGKLVTSNNLLNKNKITSKSKKKISSKKYKLNNKNIISTDIFMNIRKTVHSNTLSTNKFKHIKRKNLQRKNLLVINNNGSINSINETASFIKHKNKNERILTNKIKKNISICNKLNKIIRNNKTHENMNTGMSTNEIIVNDNNKQKSDIKKKEKSMLNLNENKKYILASDADKELSIKMNVNDKVDIGIDSTNLSNMYNDKISVSCTNSIDNNVDLRNKQSDILGSEANESSSINLQTSKKRLANNITVVTKSGKILIVEKKKKLTKEVPKFFCNVCTTSFTRKSSLKKHNLSQSHILQITMSSNKKDSKENQELCQISKQSENLVIDDSEQITEFKKEGEKNRADDKENKEEKEKINISISIEREKELKKVIIEELKEAKIDKISSNIAKDFNKNSLIITESTSIHKSPEEELEDEMLDEEICKITENMSHDEYVLTDHVTPVTPEINSISVKEINNLIKIKKTPLEVSKKKKEKRKKNLADEHLDLNTPTSTQILHLEPKIISNIINVQNSSVNKNVLKNDIISNETEILKISNNLENINKSDVTEILSVCNNIENKTKKDLEKKVVINKSKPTIANRNIKRNIKCELLTNSLKNSRPKRNKLRLSYKEDENFDFDIIESSEEIVERKHAFSRPKRNKHNTNLTKLVQNNYQIDIKQKKNVTNVRNDNTNKSVSEISIFDLEKDDKKSKGKKNQNKKKSNKFNNIEYLNFDFNLEENIKKQSITDSISKSVLRKTMKHNFKLEQGDKINGEIIDAIQKIETPKKKRGRKPKQPKIEKDTPTMEKNVLIKNDEKVPIIVIESVIEKKINIDEQKFYPNLKTKSIKNQNRRKNIINDNIIHKNTDNICKFNEAEITEILSEKELILKKEQENEEIKSKANILLESSVEISKNTLTGQSKVNIPSIPVEASKFYEIKAELPGTLTNTITDNAQQFIYSNLNIDNLNAFNETKNKFTVAMITGFDSDDNSLDTNISVDIQKLLDDPEMTKEMVKLPNVNVQEFHALNNVEPVDVNIKEPTAPDYSTETLSTIIKEEKSTRNGLVLRKSKDRMDINRFLTSNNFINKKSLKVTKTIEEKKLKHCGTKQNKNYCKMMNEPSIMREESEIEKSKQDKVQNSKNKIVKNVFGRVFVGEKMDKVKEVLDDWQSRSEYNTSDIETKQFNRTSRSRIRKALRSSSSIKKLLQSHSRSRQSKKRAEELISRVFNNDSPILNKKNVVNIQKLLKKNQEQSVIPFEKKLAINKFSQGNNLCNNSIAIKQMSFKSNKGKKKHNVKQTVISICNLKQCKYKHKKELPKKIIDKSEGLQVSQSTVEHENVQELEVENINNDCEQNKVEKLNANISPLYIHDSNIGENTLRSVVSEDDVNNKECQKMKIKSRKNKVGSSTIKKVLLRSAQAVSSLENTDESIDVVTIATTDTEKHNVLNVEMSLVEKNNLEKLKQEPKVLNFDEELFVECCSRLKATSEKELRGAKKIKLDHSSDQATEIGSNQYQPHHRKDEQFGYKGETKDRWRDVDNQNNLGSLLESVNQLLGEEYTSQEKEYDVGVTKQGQYQQYEHEHHFRENSDHSTLHINSENGMKLQTTYDVNLSYDDSLDVAFEHNNKLRDKIQQRMRDSENLIATSFNQKNNDDELFEGYLFDRDVHADKSKISGSLDGLLDKALSNLLHNNEKHDQNGSTPMKLLAELACARAPTSTTSMIIEQSSKLSPTRREVTIVMDECKQQHEKMLEPKFITLKKSKNSIKELFERKRELYEKKQLERMNLSIYKSEDKFYRQRKERTTQFNVPVIRITQYRSSMAQRKRHRDDNGSLTKKKEQGLQGKTIKDVYDFDEEETATEVGFSSVLSYRTKSDVPNKLSMSALLSKTIGDTLTNGKSVSAIGENLESMIDRKFRDIDNFTLKSKINKKIFHKDKSRLQQEILGPAEEYTHTKKKLKHSSSKPNVNTHSIKSKRKRRRNLKKKSRNAWYEDDSSDEFITKLKADNIGVGISKTQRTCSKGKQNLFAEMSSTSSESEFDRALEDKDKNTLKLTKLVAVSKPMDQLMDELSMSKMEEQLKNKKKITNCEIPNDENQKYWMTKKANNVKYKFPFLNKSEKMSDFEHSIHPLRAAKHLKESRCTEQYTNTNNEIEENSLELNDLYCKDNLIINLDRNEISARMYENKFPKVRKLSETTLCTTSLSEQYCTTGIKKYIALKDALELDHPQQNDFEESRPNSGNFYKETKQLHENLSKYAQGKLPEKLLNNEKPHYESENLPLHVFLSRKVKESKKRKQQQLKQIRKEQNELFLELQPIRRQRKCAVGKQGLLAEISSSDEEILAPNKKFNDKVYNTERQRSKQKQRESKEKRKERCIEKKHEQMIAKEQKAIEEAIMRDLEEKKQSILSKTSSSKKDDKIKLLNKHMLKNKNDISLNPAKKFTPRKIWYKQKLNKTLDRVMKIKTFKSDKQKYTDTDTEQVLKNSIETLLISNKKKEALKTSQKSKKYQNKTIRKQCRSRSRPVSFNRDKDVEKQHQQHFRSFSSKRESELQSDEELKTAKSWNQVDKEIGVAIGRRKRVAVNQLYYWSSSSDEEEMQLASVTATTVTSTTRSSTISEVQILAGETFRQENQENDRLEQHGWIVGDSHKKMITMLAMEKQMKEKRRRSENDEQSVGEDLNVKTKSKKHRNSTS